jgi:hypothetical protein
MTGRTGQGTRIRERRGREERRPCPVLTVCLPLFCLSDLLFPSGQSNPDPNLNRNPNPNPSSNPNPNSNPSHNPTPNPNKGQDKEGPSISSSGIADRGLVLSCRCLYICRRCCRCLAFAIVVVDALVLVVVVKTPAKSNAVIFLSLPLSSW